MMIVGIAEDADSSLIPLKGFSGISTLNVLNDSNGRQRAVSYTIRGFWNR